MKINIEPVKNMFGKKTKEYKAIFNQWDAIGATKEEAKQNLLDGIEWYFSDNWSNKYEWVDNNTVAIMERDFSGFSIKTMHFGKHTGSYIMGRMSSREAENYFKKYVEDYKQCLAPAN